MLAIETAIFRNNIFQKTPLTGCYSILLKRLEPELLVFENIANHSDDFTKKKAQSKTFRTHLNTNTLWNLEFAIFDFNRYKTRFHRARFPYSSLMRTKQNQIYLDLLPLLFFASFMKNQHYEFFSHNRHRRWK